MAVTGDQAPSGGKKLFADGAAPRAYRLTRSRGSSTGMQAVLAGAAGFLLTVLYDVLTNSAVWLMFRGKSAYVATLVGGMSFPFPLAHALGNTLTCAVLAPAVCRVWRRRWV